ncbi:MAG TPA: hypothetical protein VNA29_07610 [Sphingomicrobium sp.]|nr:hypothetical protein [Sphingomicrobium sp.]
MDSIASKLGVPRQALVFLKQLRRIAALAVIAGIAAAVTGHSLRTLSAAATTTAALTIVDQDLLSLSLAPARPVTVLSSLSKESVGPVAADRPAP